MIEDLFSEVGLSERSCHAPHLWWRKVIVSTWPSLIPLWGSSLLHFMHRPHYCLIHFVSNLFHLPFTVECPPNCLVRLNELLKLS